MFIYIDESGSLNNIGRGNFSVALLFVKEDIKKKTIRKFKERNREFKIKHTIQLNEEIKGHYLKESSLLEEGKELLIKSIKECQGVIAYQANSDISARELRNKNAKFNQMVKCGIERGIDNGMIDEGERINIQCDERNITLKGLNSLKDYLDIYFMERKLDIEVTNITYADSSKNYGVQLADLLSFYSFR